MQRDIWIRITYEINTDNRLEVTPIERVKVMVEEDMIDYFAIDEGFCGLNVEVEDSEQ